MKEFYQRHLPHYQPLGYTFFVTFRLAGTFPNYKINELKEEHERELANIAEIEDEKMKKEEYHNYQKRYFQKSNLSIFEQQLTWLWNG